MHDRHGFRDLQFSPVLRPLALKETFSFSFFPVRDFWKGKFEDTIVSLSTN
jgi:hypothetical protein